MTEADFDDLERYLMRPATAGDISDLQRFAAASAFGITTLPVERSELLDRVERSARAFADEDAASGEEIFLFVLEDRARGRVIGTSGIAASAGGGRHFYSYRNEYIVHSRPPPEPPTRIHTLNLCQDLTGATLLTSFYIEPEYERTLAPQLLSRARLLFIAQFADRFAERIAAESPGLADEDGYCPFWEAVGRRFFAMGYPEAERLATGRTKPFIGQLLPQSPLYVALMSQEAQWAIGQLHPVAELPFTILQEEGFDADTYVDIFDAGPIVDARASSLRTIATSRIARAGIGSNGARGGSAAAGRLHLAATANRESFRAAFARVSVGATGLSAELPDSLVAADEERVRVAPVFEAAPGQEQFDD